MRNIALEIFHRALAAIDVESAVRASVRLEGDYCEIGDDTLDLSRFNRVIVIAIGSLLATFLVNPERDLAKLHARVQEGVR